VAQAAHVGKGTIYRYFEDKDDLFLQTATSGFAEMCELLRREVPGDAPFEQRLLGACQQITGFFARRGALLRMMDAEAGRIGPGHLSLRQRWQRERKSLVMAVAEILREGALAKRVRADLPPEILADYLLGMLRTRARDLADAPEVHRRLEVVLELFIHGSAARPAGKRTTTKS
jgi:AcrR family transcriptional regulator